jgi:hypothetical protein
MVFSEEDICLLEDIGLNQNCITELSKVIDYFPRAKDYQEPREIEQEIRNLRGALQRLSRHGVAKMLQHSTIETDAFEWMLAACDEAIASELDVIDDRGKLAVELCTVLTRHQIPINTSRIADLAPIPILEIILPYITYKKYSSRTIASLMTKIHKVGRLLSNAS